MTYNTINRTCSSCLWLILLCSLFSCSKKKDATPGTNPPRLPVITGFTPDVSWYNHTVEISGNNFSEVLLQDSVTVGTSALEVLQASTTKLTVRVKPGTQRGYIHVKINGREAVSDRELVIDQLAWQKALGGSGDEMGKAIYPAAGGGYFVMGGTESKDGDITTIGKGGYDMWFAKLDSTRHIVWQRSLGGSNEDMAVAAAPTADGGLLAAAYSYSADGDFKGGHGGVEIWVIRIDGNGTVLWKKPLGGSDTERPTSIVVAPDGSCLVAGITFSKNGDVVGQHGSGDMWVVKLDATGNLVWQKALGSTGDDYAYSVAFDADGGCLVAGGSAGKDGDVTNPHGGYDVWVVKLNTNGGLVWQKTMGGTGYDAATCIQATPDGGSIVAAEALSADGDVTNPHGGYDMWIVKLNAAGSIQWQKTIGGSAIDVPISILTTSDGGYEIAGITNSTNGDITGNRGGQDIWIAKLNADRTLTGQRTLGSSNNENLFGMAGTADNGYVLAGYSSKADGDVLGTHGMLDMWFLKVWQ